MKTGRSCVWGWLLATLASGGAFSLQAQDDATDTNAAPTNATAASEATTNAGTTNTVAAADPAQKSEPEGKPAASSGRLDYSSFKLVGERNIFNGNRSGQRLTATRSSTQQRSVRVESFSLVGTLLSDNEPVAFFDGTSAEFRKALKAGGNIAGFTVKEILHAGVRLAEGTNTLEVRVGTGLRREDEGLWKSSTTGTSYASSSSGGAAALRSRSDGNNGRSFTRNGRNGSANGGGDAGNSSAGSNPGSDTAPSAEVNEVLKRLMEKREKE